MQLPVGPERRHVDDDFPHGLRAVHSLQDPPRARHVELAVGLDHRQWPEWQRLGSARKLQALRGLVPNDLAGRLAARIEDARHRAGVALQHEDPVDAGDAVSVEHHGAGFVAAAGLVHVLPGEVGLLPAILRARRIVVVVSPEHHPVAVLAQPVAHDQLPDGRRKILAVEVAGPSDALQARETRCEVRGALGLHVHNPRPVCGIQPADEVVHVLEVLRLELWTHPLAEGGKQLALVRHEVHGLCGGHLRARFHADGIGSEEQRRLPAGTPSCRLR
mmetsp:Transcript_2100/g.5816  ORF Transcript_2100/g.5816 Transcript_2100/m.5816 type:complete len:275 (+) Transcript_2100:682-1506(+)